MEPANPLRRAPTAAWRTIDGQVAIISTDMNRVRLLNGVASYVWERCEGLALEAVIDAVCHDFAVDRATAERDVRAFVTEMVSRGMLLTDGGATG